MPAMHKTRITYFALIVVTIITGLLSRHINGVPLFIGDILWALMVYFMARFILIDETTKLAVIASLVFSYGIEFSQLYQAPWINSVRHTVIGGLVLGQTFLWSDMLCYTVGIGLGVLIELSITPRR